MVNGIPYLPQIVFRNFIIFLVLKNNTCYPMKRRDFIQKSATAAAATGLITTLPGTLSASSRILGANERVNVGAIGLNGMGMSDLESFLKMD